MKNPHYVDWDYLRRSLRTHKASDSLREFAKGIPGISASTLSRFLQGGELDLESLIILASNLPVKITDIIREGSRQVEMFSREV